MNRAIIKQEAIETIKGNRLSFWGASICIGAITFAISLVSGLFSKILGGGLFGVLIGAVFSVISFVVSTTLTLGLIKMMKDLMDGESIKFTDVFSCFDLAVKASWMQVLMSVKIFLWSLLLVVPGIIAAYRYAMAQYILLDNPELTASQCINASKEMMNGYKVDLFVFGLSFIGWGLLCGITLGIASIWVAPFMAAAMANFYIHLRDN